MTRNAVAVFGALRQADEHELDVTTLAMRTELSWRQVAAGAQSLCELRLVRRRRICRRQGGRSSVVFSLERQRG